jgi:hypothetical protein
MDEIENYVIIHKRKGEKVPSNAIFLTKEYNTITRKSETADTCKMTDVVYVFVVPVEPKGE